MTEKQAEKIKKLCKGNPDLAKRIISECAALSDAETAKRMKELGKVSAPSEPLKMLIRSREQKITLCFDGKAEVVAEKNAHLSIKPWYAQDALRKTAHHFEASDNKNGADFSVTITYKNGQERTFCGDFSADSGLSDHLRVIFDMKNLLFFDGRAEAPGRYAYVSFGGAKDYVYIASADIEENDLVEVPGDSIGRVTHICYYEEPPFEKSKLKAITRRVSQNRE